MPQNTRKIYDQSADELSRYYDAIGARDGDIDLAFALADSTESPVVLELGCGNGRDARAIVEHTPYYTGIDTSSKMIAKAKERLPSVRFEQADAITYTYPTLYDIVFAFAPLRHMDIDEVTTVLRKVYDALRPGGVLYISSNFSQKYEVTERQHPHGVRKIYNYNPDIIQKHAPHGFKRVRELYDKVNNEPWFEVVLKKAF